MGTQKSDGNLKYEGGVAAAVSLFLAFWTVGKLGVGLETAAGVILAWILVDLSRSDLKTMTIPNRDIVLLLIPALLSIAAELPLSGQPLPVLPQSGLSQFHLSSSLLDRMSGAFAVSIPMMAMNLMISGSFGGGDIKLMAVSGLILGFQGILVAAFLAILSGGVYSIFLLVTGRMRRGGHFAFGPFLAGGIFLSFLYGRVIFCWYLSFFPT